MSTKKSCTREDDNEKKLAKPTQKRLKARVDTFTYMQQVLHISFLNFFNSTKKIYLFLFFDLKQVLLTGGAIFHTVLPPQLPERSL